MFFPLHDENPRQRFPIITTTLIALNVLIWILQIPLSRSEQASILQAWAVVPQNYTGGGDGPLLLPLLSSLFMHAGLMHLAGNMWFLWLFGDNLEEELEPFPFVVFYLLSGLAATFSHIAVSPNSAVPLVGASGAISGVMAGYLVMFPHVNLRVLVFLFRFGRIIDVSAWVFMGLWILFQVLMSAAASPGKDGGGVAFMAHVGGFVGGLLLILVLRKTRQARG